MGIRWRDMGAKIIFQTYELVSNRTHITYPTGEVVTSTFDGDGRLLTVQAWDGSLTPAAGVVQYSYDQSNRLI